MPEEKTPTPEEEFSAAWKEAEILEKEETPPSKPEEEEKKEEKKEEKLEEKEEEEEEEEEVLLTPTKEELVQEKEHRRRSILGRIQANRKGADSLEATYRKDYGRLPWEKTPEQVKKDQETKAVAERVGRDVPELDTAIQYAVEERLRKFEERMQEMDSSSSAKTQLVAHEATIRALHPDLDAYRDLESVERKALEEWIGSLPTDTGIEYIRVMQDGKAVEVSDMLSTFKEEVTSMVEELNIQNNSQEKEKRAVQAQTSATRVRGAGSAMVVTQDKNDPDDWAAGWKEHERLYKGS